MAILKEKTKEEVVTTPMMEEPAPASVPPQDQGLGALNADVPSASDVIKAGEQGAKQAFSTLGETFQKAGQTIQNAQANLTDFNAPLRQRRSVEGSGAQGPATAPSGRPAAETGKTLTDPLTGEKVFFDTTTPEGQGKLAKATEDFAAARERQRREKELKGQTDDAISNALSFFSDIADPTTADPVREAEFNWTISKLNPTFQAQNAGTVLRLKQAGIDPNAPGAGAAILAQVARGANATVADVIGKLNVESANRIMEANRYGIEMGMEVQEHQINMARNNFAFGAEQMGFLANTLKSTNPADYARVGASMGLPPSTNYEQLMKDIASENIADNSAATRAIMSDYKGMNDMVAAMVPGLDVNLTDFAGLPQEDVTDITSRLAAIQQDLMKSPPDKDAARRKIRELQSLYPNVIRGDYANWDPDDFNSLGAFNRNQQNMTVLSSMVFQAGANANDLFKSAEWSGQHMVDPDTFEEDWDRMWGTMNAGQKRRNLELAGLNPDNYIDKNGNQTGILTDDEMKLSLGADMVRGIQDSTNQTQIALDTLTQSNPVLKEWVLDSPENERHFRAYLHSMLSGNVAKIENGQLVVDNGKILDPTNPQSDIAHYFLDWPDGTDENGKWVDSTLRGSVAGTYAGNQPIQDGNYAQDAAGAAYQENVTKAWENYQHLEGKLDRMSWFDEAKPDASGNTKAVKLSDKDVTEGSLAGGFEQKTITMIDEIFGTKDEPGTLDLTDPRLTSDAWDLIMRNPALKTKVEQAIPVFVANDPKLQDTGKDPRTKLDAAGIRADEYVDVQDTGISQANSAGAGQGTVIIHNGRPMRVVKVLSQWRNFGGGAFGQTSQRNVSITGQYLDSEGGIATIGGSGGWVDA